MRDNLNFFLRVVDHRFVPRHLIHAEEISHQQNHRDSQQLRHVLIPLTVHQTYLRVLGEKGVYCRNQITLL